MNDVFFTSDTHFHHKKILEYSPTTRQGDTVEEMNELIIEAWNEKVRPNDTVYHLGDFSFGKAEQTIEILKRLDGNIHLILGNHDKVTAPMENLFFTVNPYKTIKIDGKHIVLFHFPIECWDRQHHGSLHLFGHMHGNAPSHNAIAPIPNRMDVGIDTRTDMSPWSWDEIKQHLGV